MSHLQQWEADTCLKYRSPAFLPQLKGIGSRQPETRFTQQEVFDLFGFENPVVKKFMQAPHIKTRHLLLPLDEDGKLSHETPAQLHAKFAKYGVLYGISAIEDALRYANLQATDIDYICAVTSTGYLVPGLAARLIQTMGMKPSIQKSDIVGMGCNAAVSSLIQVSNWAKANPGKNAVMVCVEISSAAYVADNTTRTGIVNSLFGDNASAIVISQNPEKSADSKPSAYSPFFVDFESLIVTDQIDSMRYDFDAEQNKFSFYLSRDIPFVIGDYVPVAVQNLLRRPGYFMS